MPALQNYIFLKFQLITQKLITINPSTKLKNTNFKFLKSQKIQNHS